MTQYKNSMEQQLTETNRQHANAVALSLAYQQALTSLKDEVVVDLKNADGTVSQVKVKTNSKIWSKLTEIEATLLNVSGLAKDRSNTLVSLDDNTSFREIFVQSYNRAYPKAKASEITFDTNIKTNTNSVIESLLSPLTTVETSLAQRFLEANEVLITKFVISEGDFTAFTDGDTYSSVLQKLLDTSNNYAYKKVEYLLDTVKRDTRYYGEFDVLSHTVNDDSTITVKVNTTKYSDKLNIVENSRGLVVGNKLVTESGSNRYNILEVDESNNTIKIKSEAGYATLLNGTAKLSILSVESSETRKVRIPVKLKERSIIFVSPVNKHTNAESPYSEAKLFDSSDYIVEEGNNTFKFDEYFASKVADIGTYFESIVRESAIPAALGQVPEKPEISSEFFNVVQINKHLTNTPEASKLKTMQRDYQRTASEISVLNNEISTINARISKGKYASATQKAKDVSTLSAKIRTKSEKSAYAASLVTDIDTALNNTTATNVTPKYRVRGFWPIQTDIPSTVTDPQKIVQYEVRYRYAANNKTTTDADQMSYTDKNGSTINAVFSPWNYVKTEPRTKYKTADGQYKWSDNNVSSVEEVNMNQLDIAMQYGENVELQVRALSEAGWPTAPIVSEWSTLTPVKFPAELLQESTVASIARLNAEALRKVELQEEFKTQGITQHISSAFEEQGIYFAHDTRDISSGFRAEDQTMISLFDFLNTLRQENTELKEIVNRRYAIISPQIVESSDRVYEVSKFQKIKLFAGYYTDNINLSDKDNYGEVVTRIFYLRFNNKNAQTVEMLSLSPGTLSATTTNASYTDVPISVLGQNGTPKKQLNGQIFYARSKDISGSEDFFITDQSASVTTVPSEDIDNSAVAASKDVVHLNGNSIEVIKLAANASLEDYVTVSTSHPAYVEYTKNNANTQNLLNEFERIKQYNQTYKADVVQNVYDPNRAVEYIADDKYLVGKNSVGARLFTQPNQMSSIQVNGIDTSSAVQIHSGDSNAIIVPLVFQYRMTDAVGHVDGSTTTTTNSNFQYTKSIGIDLLVKGETFRFDVEVSAKFRPTSISNNNLGIQTTRNIETSTRTSTRID